MLSLRPPTLFGLAALASCGRDAPPDPPRFGPASISSVAQALGVDAATLEVPVDPPSPPGDLRSDIDRYTTLEACVAEHAQTDPLISDSLHALGYDTFLRDACRMLDAMKTKRPETCAPIDAGGLRARCQASVAMVTQSPEQCPWEVPDTPTRGRDATCVAVASRDSRLCMAATRTDHVRCEALVARSEERCGARGEDREKSACTRDVQRWRRVLDAPQVGLAAIPAPRGRLELHGVEGSSDPSHVDTDLASDLARGVVVTEGKDGLHLAFGSALELGVTNFAPSPAGRVRFALAIAVPAEKPGAAASIEHAELAVPGKNLMVVPGARCDCGVKVVKLGRARGDEVHLVFEGTIGAAPNAYRARADVTTFVRDVATTTASRAR